MKSYRALVFGVILAVVSACENVSTNGARVRAPEDRRLAPRIQLKDTDGDNFELTQYRGRVVLLNFWETDCRVCELERPALNELQESYGTSRVVIVGIALDRDPGAVRPFLARRRFNFRIAYADERLTERFGGIDGVPTTMFIDRDGKLAVTTLGAHDKSFYRATIAQLF